MEEGRGFARLQFHDDEGSSSPASAAPAPSGARGGPRSLVSPSLVTTVQRCMRLSNSPSTPPVARLQQQHQQQRDESSPPQISHGSAAAAAASASASAAVAAAAAGWKLPFVNETPILTRPQPVAERQRSVCRRLDSEVDNCSSEEVRTSPLQPGYFYYARPRSARRTVSRGSIDEDGSEIIQEEEQEDDEAEAVDDDVLLDLDHIGVHLHAPEEEEEEEEEVSNDVDADEEDAAVSGAAAQQRKQYKQAQQQQQQPQQPPQTSRKPPPPLQHPHQLSLQPMRPTHGWKARMTGVQTQAPVLTRTTGAANPRTAQRAQLAEQAAWMIWRSWYRTLSCGTLLQLLLVTLQLRRQLPKQNPIASRPTLPTPTQSTRVRRLAVTATVARATAMQPRPLARQPFCPTISRSSRSRRRRPRKPMTMRCACSKSIPRATATTRMSFPAQKVAALWTRTKSPRRSTATRAFTASASELPAGPRSASGTVLVGSRWR
eukprot:m.160846 g.160846  ORF g.160846 m.160846 type:complete len:489 (-) comp17056_c2_seq10:4322-5788(-)